MLLAIDTATRTASVALFDERGVVCETTWRTHENHTQSLMPEIVRQLELAHTGVSDLQAIGVATGPGSFTGLRIGLSAAKGLALATGAVIIGVPTLDISARPLRHEELPILAVIEAGRARYAAAWYQGRAGAAERVSDYIFGAAQALVASVERQADAHPCVWVTGELDSELESFLADSVTNVQIRTDVLWNVRRASSLADLAYKRWLAGRLDDLTTLAPFYIPTASLA